MHKPWHTLLFTIALFLVMGALGLVFPEEGIKLGGKLALSFPSTPALFKNPEEKADITALLEAVNKVDTTFRIDEPGEAVDTSAQVLEPPNLRMDIQHPERNALANFYDALRVLKNKEEQIRVLHYGDSQIEGDRITDYLRLKLQGQFGGSGPGLLSLTPLTARASTKIYKNEEWLRYTTFTAKDKTVPHNSYGVRAAFSRFAPYTADADSAALLSASIQLVSAAGAGYNKVRLYYGGARKRTWCEFFDGPALVSADSLEAGGNFHWQDFEVGRGSNSHQFNFSGFDSPDFYALSLESEKGVMVDNIAMRGSSGTFFHRLDRDQMTRFYKQLNVKLIILQFGGNALPSLEDSTMAGNYARYISRQIGIVKKLAPAASILFIGPSDMSVKRGTDYVTYELLEPLRDYLREAVLSSGCAYFDLYDVMGGRNSMPAWVEEKLAGKDYTHFSPKGARKVATLLYAAIIKDYNNYTRTLK